MFFFASAFFVFLLFGSLANALIYRIPRKIPLGLFKATRSFCPQCKSQISFYDNIPLFSFLILKGRCRKCTQKIPFRYFLVEFMLPIFLTVAFVLFFKYSEYESFLWTKKFWIELILNMYLMYTLVLVSLIDFDFKKIPNRFSLGNLFLVLIAAALGYLIPLKVAFVGAGLSFMFFLILALLSEKMTGKISLGLGDVKFITFIGAWLGLFLLPYVLIVACFLAVLIFFFLSKKLKIKSLPFAPYLSFGAYVLWCFKMWKSSH